MERILYTHRIEGPLNRAHPRADGMEIVLGLNEAIAKSGGFDIGDARDYAGNRFLSINLGGTNNITWLRTAAAGAAGPFGLNWRVRSNSGPRLSDFTMPREGTFDVFCRPAFGGGSGDFYWFDTTRRDIVYNQPSDGGVVLYLDLGGSGGKVVSYNAASDFSAGDVARLTITWIKDPANPSTHTIGRIYINGELKTTGSPVAVVPNASPSATLHVGHRVGLNRDYQGEMYWWAISNRAWSDAEALAAHREPPWVVLRQPSIIPLFTGEVIAGQINPIIGSGIVNSPSIIGRAV